MLRVCLYLIFAVAISLICAWIAMNPGEVKIEFLDYQVTTSMALLLLAIILIFIVIRIILLPFALGDAWRVYALKRAIKSQQKLMFEYLTTVGENNVKKYPALAAKITKDFDTERELKDLMLLNITSGLEKANILQSLASEKGTELLSLKHQIEDAVAAGKMGDAQEMYKTAFAKYPKAKWVVKPYINLLALFEEWDKVTDAVTLAFKRGGLGKKEYLLMLSSAMLEKGRMENNDNMIIKAAKLCSSNVAAGIVAALIENKAGNRKKALAILASLWQKMPSLDVYYAMTDVVADLPDFEKIKKLAKVIGKAKDCTFNNIVLADAYTKVGMWGQAKALAEKYVEVYPNSAFAIKIMATIESNTDANSSSAKMWQERAANNTDGLKTWLCTNCGKRYNEWHSVCANCKNFADINMFLGGE